MKDINGAELNHYIKNVISPGDDSGNGMMVRFGLPSGLEIIGLPTKNFYGGHWDLGPTWNYAVLADKPFLVDSGRFGQGKNLVEMMTSVGIKAEDLEFVVISHGHEDHDGGLAELVRSTHLRVKAHAIYERLIRKYPSKAPRGHKEDFPAKCWHCPMPESFYSKNCLGYHQVLQRLTIEPIGDGANELMTDVHTHHLPGHSPDCVAVLVGSEAIIVGDIVLPDITPWPTREEAFNEIAEVVKPHYTRANRIFGLDRYIKSLKKLGEIAAMIPDLLVLPAHRFYFRGQWNGIQLADRVNELLEHHVHRCAAIIEILQNGSKTAEELAREHFEESLLEGFGSIMAANEIISHCELLARCGDIVRVNGNEYEQTGTGRFESYILPNATA
jgi:glyoxylase-like metal-dependent hydrolase (beta-lactamase superfamily II)